jgi:Flp pilus assembly protein TadD
MKKTSIQYIVFTGLALITTLVVWQITRSHFHAPVSFEEPVSISIDYPLEGSIFPPEFLAPAWLWRDPHDKATFWQINIIFSDGSPSIRVQSAGERMQIGETDPRCSSFSNKPPALTALQAAAHTWVPDSITWSAIKKHSVNRAAKIVITGHPQGDSKVILSTGQITIQTSNDSVGAPIFYRDVPLMPSENEKGVIKPLATQATPLIAWRLRSVGEKRSRLLMDGLHTCVNCHSFSADGKTLGMDMDGPRNDKGLYALVDVQPQMEIRRENLVAWSTFRGKLGSTLRVGFMSQISPDARYVITTVNDPGTDQTDYERRKNPIDLVQSYYVANFKDYRFLQVFYPTRGVLAWYNPQTTLLHYLPGADDTNYVHANAVWSPDGKYLVFARAPARDAYPSKGQLAQYANDSNETQIQYDLYRIPFNDGKGGIPEPIAGASRNGMSNSFPKISPDGRWIVFVQSRNGLLMRPDGQLFIVPANGGTARHMKCNTPLMNSWHSFSPNSRWLVFSSKSRTPYTQMFLTYIDSTGDDSPAILIDNATAANRAVNIPEFVNVSADGIANITAPAADYALHTDRAVELMKNHQYENAILEWNKAMVLAPGESRVHNSLGVALMETGKVDEAILHYRKALELNPQYTEAYCNLGEALAGKGIIKEAIAQFKKAVQQNADYTIAHSNLGTLLARTGQTDEAIFHLQKVLNAMPDDAEANRNLGHALAEKGKIEDASVYLEKAVKLSSEKDPLALFLLGRVYADLGRYTNAIQIERKAIQIAMQQNNSGLIQAINVHLNQLPIVR